MTLLDNITDINPEDWKLFREFFKTEWHEPNYANAWAYIIQACRGAGGLGKKFYDGETLIGLGKHNGHPVLVRPVGKRKPQKIHDLAHQLKEHS